MKDRISNTVEMITRWLQEGNLYYSSDNKRFYAGFNGGMGNFDLLDVFTELTGFIVDWEPSKRLIEAGVIGELRTDNHKTDDFQGYFVQISKVINAEIYGNQHDNTVASALFFASKHHRKQIRKATGEPYINHLAEVLQTLTYFEPGCDENTRVAAVLHDIVEDTPVTIESIDFLFGSEVAGLVSQLTCTNAKDSKDKKQRLLEQISIADKRAKQIKLADITSNAMLLPASWSIEKRSSYLKWCSDVGQICSDSSENLYANFIARMKLIY